MWLDLWYKMVKHNIYGSVYHKKTNRTGEADGFTLKIGNPDERITIHIKDLVELTAFMNGIVLTLDRLTKEATE